MLTELIGGQEPGARYQWRVRLLSDKATAPPQQASRWLPLPTKHFGIPLFRTGASGPARLSWFLAE